MTAVLRCFVDDETLKWLEKASAETGRNIEQLAEAAIENAAIEFKVSRIGLAHAPAGICTCAAMGKRSIPHARNCPALSPAERGGAAS